MPKRIKASATTLILLFAGNPTTIDSPAIVMDGLIKNIWVTVPTLDSGTATLNVKDSAGNLLYTKASLAAGATTSCALTTDVPVGGNITLEIVTSASQTANRTFVITPYIDSYI